MAKLDFRNASFQPALQPVIAAYRQALAAVDEQREAAFQAQLDHDRFLDEGGEDEATCDGDEVLYYRSQVLNFAHDDACKSSAAIREAFAVSLFHLWERSARGWVNYREQGFDGLAKAMRKSGIPFNARMATLNDLVNFLKHDSRDNDAALRRKLRDYVHGPMMMVLIDDAQIEALIDIVSTSRHPRRHGAGTEAPLPDVGRPRLSAAASARRCLLRSSRSSACSCALRSKNQMFPVEAQAGRMSQFASLKRR